VKHIIEEILDKAPKLITGFAVAGIFLAVGFVSSQVVGGFSSYLGLLVWTSFFVVGILFLVKTMFEAVAIGDDAVKSLLNRIGVHEAKARDRILKEIMYMIIAILAAAAVFPFLNNIGGSGVWLKVTGTYIVLAIVVVFVYDIGRTLHQVSRMRVKRVTDWIVDQRTNPASSKIEKLGKESAIHKAQRNRSESVMFVRQRAKGQIHLINEKPDLSEAMESQSRVVSEKSMVLVDVNGIGPKRAKTLKDLGVNTVEALIRCGAAEVSKKVGVPQKTAAKWIENAKQLAIN
jgi:predicted flap endonuclease-1-like 5' DNA nuclease